MARRRSYLGRSVYLQDCFYNEIFVWMCENSKNLEEATEYFKVHNKEYYSIINEIQSDSLVMSFVESTLEKCNHKPYPELLDEMRKERDDMLYGRDDSGEE